MTSSKPGIDIDEIAVNAQMMAIRQKLLTGQVRSLFVGTIDADGKKDAWWVIAKGTTDRADALALMDGIASDIRAREENIN